MLFLSAPPGHAGVRATMNRSLLVRMTYALIFAVQVPVFLVGIIWYPDVVARMLAWRQSHALSGWDVLSWNVAMTVVIVSPMLLLVGPYQVAHAFWQRLPSPRGRNSRGRQAV